MTHSPGPWRWEGDPRCAIVDANGDVVFNLHNIDEEPRTWSEILGSNHDLHDRESEAQANARLMALAPELLEAVEAHLGDLHPTEDLGFNVQRLRELVKAARTEGCP